LESEIKTILHPLVSKAELQWHTNADQVSWVNVLPRRPSACGFFVAWSSHEIVISIGEHARMELGPDEQGLALLGRIVASISAGRVSRIGRGKGERYRILLLEEKEGPEKEVNMYGGLTLKPGSREESTCQPY
jgi:hypothetical protein